MGYTRNEPFPAEIIDPATGLPMGPGDFGSGGGFDTQAAADIAEIKASTADAADKLTDLLAIANSSDPNTTVRDITQLRRVALTLTLDTSGAHGDGELLFENLLVANAARAVDAPFYLVGVKVIGEDDQGQPFDLYFHDTSSDWGTLNSAPTIADADGRGIVGRVQILSGDFYDLGGMRYADKHPLAVAMSPVSGSRDVRISGISRGTGTYTANGMRLVLYFD